MLGLAHLWFFFFSFACEYISESSAFTPLPFQAFLLVMSSFSAISRVPSMCDNRQTSNHQVKAGEWADGLQFWGTVAAWLFLVEPLTYQGSYWKVSTNLWMSAQILRQSVPIHSADVKLSNWLVLAEKSGDHHYKLNSWGAWISLANLSSLTRPSQV